MKSVFSVTVIKLSCRNSGMSAFSDVLSKKDVWSAGHWAPQQCIHLILMQASLMLAWGSLSCKNVMVVILVLTLAHGSCIGKAASHDLVGIDRTLTVVFDPISASAGGADHFAL